MQEVGTTSAVVAPSVPAPGEGVMDDETVSTHVLVGEEQVAKLRELSKRTRVAQSEYLREAVDDLLQKYSGPEDKP